jgi:DNA-binding LytR/AlgR family response regulator
MREPTGLSREPHGFAVRASRTVATFLSAHWRGFVTAAAAGVFMALVGAFGMDDAPLAARLAYWVPIMLAGAVIGQAIGAMTARQPKIGENAVAVWAVTTLIVTVPVTAIVWAATSAMFGRWAPTSLPYYAGAVFVVAAAMTALMMLVNRPGPATHAPPPGAPAPAIRFAQRLPAKIMGGVIWAVEAEDHYLRIHTSKGADLILMRLADAIVELEGLEGAQVHRSWWVARDGVAETRREGARVTLVLKDGAEAPVSRPNVRALRDAGWF